MPYKLDKLKLGEEFDRRRKLSEEQKKKIRKDYKTGLYSHRQLAEQYGVSKSLIGIITNEERMRKVSQRIKDHWRDYSDREEHTKAIRKTRAYKKLLLETGKLGVK